MPTDSHTNISDLKARVRAFSQARDWEQFHHPKDLALALVCEIGEVLEHFRYRTNEQIGEKLQQPAEHTALAHELADCLWLLLRMADVTGVDLAQALDEKLALADRKYPIEKVYGKPDKYTAYLPTEGEDVPPESGANRG
jgi:dCTP diphosphatase